MAHELDIQTIVDAVMARLKPPRAAATSAKPDCGCKDKTAKAAPCGCQHGATHASDELSLNDKVVCVATLDNRLDGVRRLLLRSGAVVTPSARDLLRGRSIDIAYDSKISNATSDLTLIVGIAEIDSAPARSNATAIATAIGGGSKHVERIAETGFASVVAELSDQVARGGRLAVLLTGKPDAAVCLANRRRGVRAVACRDAATAKRAIDETGANLLAVDAAMHNFQAQRLIDEFWRQSPLPCPTWLHE